MSKKKQISLLVFLIVLLLVINYPFIDSFLVRVFENFNREDFTVKRIIDGDTIVVGNDLTVRLVGINTPEKGEEYYLEAKEFVEEQIFNKTVFIEFFGKDRYYRELGIVYFNRENFNARIIEEGFANPYILDNKKYENEFRDAWEKCLVNGKNLCERTDNRCSNCISIKIDVDKQTSVFTNNCAFPCDLTNWIIKDEGRKKFVFDDFVLKSKQNIIITSEDFEEDYVWTETGDTLFLFDEEGKLVLWKEC